MKEIFIIRVPFSYVNAIEAKKYFSISPINSILVILYKNIDDIDIVQIKHIIDEKQWCKIYYLPYNLNSYIYNKYKKKKYCSIQKIKFIKSFLMEFDILECYIGNTNRAFIGDYNIASMRYIVNYLHVQNTIIIDEGGRVRKIFYDYLENRFNILNYFKNFLISSVFRYKIYDLKNISFFTSWILENNSNIVIYKNSFDVLKKQLKCPPKNNNIIFLGCPFIENRCLDLEVYKRYLCAIDDFLKNYEVIYIPHRGETYKSINIVTEITAFEINKIELPIEIYLSLKGTIPTKVCTFFSSAILSLLNLFDGNIDIISFHINREHFNWGKDRFEKQYDYYKTLNYKNFEIVKLDYDSY